MLARTPTLQQTALRQSRCAPVILAAMALPVVALDLAAHSEQFNDLIEHRRQAVCRARRRCL